MFNLLFSPYGSITRLPYFIGLVCSTLLMCLSIGLLFLPGYWFTRPHMLGAAPILTVVLYLIAAIFAGMSFWCTVCIHLKRLTDLRVTRWLILIPFIGGIAEKSVTIPPLQLFIQLLIFAYILVLLLWPSRL